MADIKGWKKIAFSVQDELNLGISSIFFYFEHYSVAMKSKKKG